MHPVTPLRHTRVATPHDDLFHFVFQHASHAAPWLRCVLPHEVANAIDWTSLRLAPDKLRGQALRLSVADLVFYAERHTTRKPVWLLVEHKAQRDPEAEGQLTRYVVHLRDRPPFDGAATPVAVVPVLLHHGDHPFAAAAEGEDAIERLHPRLTFFVDDLRATTDAALRERDMTPLGRLGLLCLRNLRGGADDAVLADFEQWADLLRSADRDPGPPAGRDAIAALGWYALRTVEVAPQALHDTFEHLLQRPEEIIMSTAEKLKREGKAEGLAEGLAVGLTKVRAAAILRMLEKRFGPLPAAVVERVHTATTAELDRWIDRIFDATTLADLFAD